MTPTFTLEEPGSVAEALEMLAASDGSTRPVAGGTGLTLLMKYGFFEPTMLVSLRRLRPELDRIEVADDGTLLLGASTTLRDLERAPQVAESASLIHDALAVLATVRLRNVAQLGGAIAHGHPQMDLPPVLLALGAQVHVRSTSGSRWIAAEDLFLGYYETEVHEGELITHVAVPSHVGYRTTYRKVTSRTVDDWPMVCVAASGATEGRAVRDVAVAIGAVGDRPVRLWSAEAELRGNDVTPTLIEDVAQHAAAGLDLHDSPNGSAAYQRRTVEVQVRRALAAVLEVDGDGRGH